MEINLIFRIAAVGILVSVSRAGAQAQRTGRTGVSGKPGRGLLLVLSWVLPYIYDLFLTIQRLSHCKGQSQERGESGMSMIQIGMIAVIGAVLAVQMKSSGRAEYATCACIAAGLLLFSFIVERLGYFTDTVGTDPVLGCGWIQDICLSC